MILTPDAPLPLDHADTQDGVLIISENPAQTTQLSQQLAEKGYKTVNLPFFSTLDKLLSEHLALIIAVNCPAVCAEISEHLRSSSVLDTPVICINDNTNLESPADGAWIDLAKQFPENAPPPLNYQIQLYRQPGSANGAITAAKGRQNTERRQSKPLISSANIMTADLPLAIVSQREPQMGALLAHFSDMNTAHCFNRLDLIGAKLQQLQPALLLVDSLLTQPDIGEWLHRIRQSDTRVKIILLYDEVVPDLIKEIVEYGVSGVIPTNASRELYTKAIQTVHQGELWLPHLLMGQIMAHFSQQSPTLARHPDIDAPDLISTSLLTQRELSITERVAQGLTNKQIAKELEVSPETIKKHLKSIFEKSTVRSRSQLASIYSHSIANGGLQRFSAD
ncbi:MAG: response regulator transcription factor [Methylobacter sp.]|jgi:DNA-binding NarL/FixJ family response regulator|nr:response regulator transcription factor [Methylobacter sp.]